MKRPRKQIPENAYLSANDFENAARKPKQCRRAKNENESRTDGGELEMSLQLSFSDCETWLIEKPGTGYSQEVSAHYTENYECKTCH